MAFEHYFAREWKSIQGVATESENSNGCFDCNICLDFAHEPVVTLCGHLYCWPCIYKWLHVQSNSLASDEHPQCPVCKADISHTTMVPLYGRGQTLNEAEAAGKASHWDMAIPPRPAACGAQTLFSTTSNTGQQLPYRNPYQDQHYNPHPYSSHEEDSTSPWLNLEGTMPGFHHPVVGMFGEMVYARVFGNSASLYTYPNSYHLVGSSNPRLRRQEMQADKSLNRISIFLFCCFLLCLMVFWTQCRLLSPAVFYTL
jgi:E3 ubiquitin-protein ligase RNF5